MKLTRDIGYKLFHYGCHCNEASAASVDQGKKVSAGPGLNSQHHRAFRVHVDNAVAAVGECMNARFHFGGDDISLFDGCAAPYFHV